MKIKRYSNIYGKSDHTWLKVVITFAAIALLVFVIFSVADPIAKLFSGEYNDNSSNEESEFNPTVSYVSGTASSLPPADSSTVSDATSSSETSSQETRPDRTEYSAGLSVTLSLDIISNGEKLDAFLQNAVAQEVKNVIIELKDDEGYLYYNSKLKNARDCKAVSSKAVTNLSTVIAKFKENGISVTAKIHCFSDRIATDIKDAAVKHQGENGGKWLDDYKEKGGKSWLNPYSDVARDYLKSIAKELTDLGVDNILLSSLRFPGGHQELAYYGYDSETISRDDCLKEFVAEVKKHLEYAGSEVWVEVGVEHYLGASPEVYGTNPFEFGADCVVANIVAEDFGTSIFINNVAIKDPYTNYKELIRNVIGKCQALNTSSSEILPMLQGFNYENEDVKEQIKEAKKYGSVRYALEINGDTLPTVK